MNKKGEKGEKKVHVYISGLVQGVFFRARTNEQARMLGLGGWVRNLPDGRVEAVFAGDEDKVDKAIQFCRVGPRGAIVKDITVHEETRDEEFDDFSIR
ncbi:acylphosphatase [Candidatus Desantisbacteria bacterium]|nr:acylphosphatase [Candidatus Desantisbacteria bacterium]